MSCAELKTMLDPKGLHDSCFSNSSAANENGKRFNLNNHSKLVICKVKVDGCLITSNSIRKCDYLFSVDSMPKKYFLVELKGIDLATAITQIESTYDQLQPILGAQPEQFQAVIVASAVPRAANLEFRKLQERMKQSKKLDLLRQSIQCEITI